MFGVFRVKNHDFTPKNHIFSNFMGGGGGGARRAPPPWIRPWYSPDVNSSTEVQIQVAIVRRPDSSTVRLPRQYVSPIAR